MQPLNCLLILKAVRLAQPLPGDGRPSKHFWQNRRIDRALQTASPRSSLAPFREPS